MYDTIREKEDPNVKKLEQLQKANALLREMATNEELTDNLNDFRANREATKNLKDLKRKQQDLDIKRQEYEMAKETKKLAKDVKDLGDKKKQKEIEEKEKKEKEYEEKAAQKEKDIADMKREAVLESLKNEVYNQQITQITARLGAEKIDAFIDSLEGDTSGIDYKEMETIRRIFKGSTNQSGNGQNGNGQNGNKKK